MTGDQPPLWLEKILLSLLCERDRQTISGDLLEEFREQVQARRGRIRATIWYACQILSFVPGWLQQQSKFRTFLLLTCSFTALSGLWLGAMGLRLRHPGYIEGEMIAGIIVSQGLLTIAALWFREVPILLKLSAIGCLPLFWLAAKAFKGLIDGSNFEGYILLIAAALVVQAVSTIAILISGRPRRRSFSK